MARITVENHFVGRLKGFLFTLDSAGDGIHEKATRQAAMQVVARELGMRARRVAAAKHDAFKLTRGGSILWRDDEIGKLERSDDPLQAGGCRFLSTNASAKPIAKRYRHD